MAPAEGAAQERHAATQAGSARLPASPPALRSSFVGCPSTAPPRSPQTSPWARFGGFDSTARSPQKRLAKTFDGGDNKLPRSTHPPHASAGQQPQRKQHDALSTLPPGTLARQNAAAPGGRQPTSHPNGQHAALACAQGPASSRNGPHPALSPTVRQPGLSLFNRGTRDPTPRAATFVSQDSGPRDVSGQARHRRQRCSQDDEPRRDRQLWR